MTPALNEDSKLAAEAALDKAEQISIWASQEEEASGREFHSIARMRERSGTFRAIALRLEAGEAVVAPTALLHEVLKHVRFHGRAGDAAAFHAKEEAFYAAIGERAP